MRGGWQCARADGHGVDQSLQPVWAPHAAAWNMLYHCTDRSMVAPATGVVRASFAESIANVSLYGGPIRMSGLSLSRIADERMLRTASNSLARNLSISGISQTNAIIDVWFSTVPHFSMAVSSLAKLFYV